MPPSVSANLATLGANGWAVNNGFTQRDVVVAASTYGLLAGTADMTAQLTLALNASLNDGTSLQLPDGDINISGEVLVSAPSRLSFTSFGGTSNYQVPIKVLGRGGSRSRIIQNQAGVRHMYYFASATGNQGGLEFRGFTLKAATQTYTDTGQCGIQIGGGTTQCITGGVRISDVGADGLYTCIRIDDCTDVIVEGGPAVPKCRYYMEAGFNADGIVFRDFAFGNDNPQDIACASSTGTTITGISALATPFIFPGMSITGAGIPADTVVVTCVAGATTLTVSNAVTAVTSFCTHLGTILSLLSTNGSVYGGSAFAAIANAGNYFRKAFGSNPNVIKLDNVLLNRGRALIEDASGIYSLSISDVYMERAQMIGTLGQNATGSNNGIDINRIFLSQPTTMRQPLLQINAQEPRGFIRNITSDGTPTNTATVHLPNFQSSGNVADLLIENCVGQVTGVFPGMSASGAGGGGGRIQIGTSKPGNGIAAFGVTNGGFAWEWNAGDRFSMTLTGGNGSILNPGSIYAFDQREIETVVTSDAAARTVTFGTAFRNADGTAYGVSGASTAASQRIIHRWRMNGPTNQFKLVNAPAWG